MPHLEKALMELGRHAEQPHPDLTPTADKAVGHSGTAAQYSERGLAELMSCCSTGRGAEIAKHCCVSSARERVVLVEH